MEGITEISKYLKTVYTDKINQEYNLNYKLLSKFEDATEDAEWLGSSVVELAEFSQGGGAMFSTPSNKFPTDKPVKADQFVIDTKYLYVPFGMTADAIKRGMRGAGAFATLMDRSMTGKLEASKQVKNRSLFGDGTGILAQVNGAVAASVTVTLDNPGNWTSTFGGSRYLRDGDIIAFTDGTTISAVGTVSGSPPSESTITMAAPVTLADNLFVVRALSPTITTIGETNLNAEPLGLKALAGTAADLGVLHGLSRTTYPQLVTRVVSTPAAMSESMLQGLVDYTSQQSGKSIDAFVCHPEVRSSYVAATATLQRFLGSGVRDMNSGSANDPFGGKQKYGDTKFQEEADAPYGVLFGLNWESFRVYYYERGKWEERDGAVLRMNPDGPHEFKAIWYQWYQTHCGTPFANFRREGITVNSGYVQHFGG
jgi:hypothetical protein